MSAIESWWTQPKTPTLFRVLASGVGDWLFGPDPESKRHMSNLLMALGLVLIPASQGATLSPHAPWPLAVGLVLVLVAYAGANRAAGQARSESRASDIIEWQREGQGFRRVMRPFWERLKDAHNTYSGATSITTSGDLQSIVDNADWPDGPNRSAELAFHSREGVRHGR